MSVFDWSEGIKITFDREIIVDPETVTGSEYYKPRPSPDTFVPVFISSGDYSGFPKENAFDTSITTYWRSANGTLPLWIGRNFGTAVTLTKVREYSGATYRPNAYQLQGSTNGIDWVDVATGNFANATGWTDITFAAATYQYWRLYVTSLYTAGRLYIYELEFYGTRDTYFVIGWLVTSQTKDMIPTGVSSLKTYSVYKITRTPDNMSVIIWLDPYDRMKYPEDLVTIAFMGSLTGQGNVPVDPFTVTFTPTNIIEVFNPNDAEYLTVNIGVSISSFDVTYIYAQAGIENITTQSDIVIIVTKVGDLPL